ncbi:MAG TPA: SRPBCC family protein [Conexibacter sp.]|jgi:hypothetical protein
MEPVIATVFIARPREEIIEYLSDVANHPEFKDHYLSDWHLTREDTVGKGAGVRFREKLPFNRFGWGDYTIVEVTPHRVVERGRSGKFNRNRTLGTWTVSDATGEMSKVEYRYEAERNMPSDRLREGRGWWKRKTAKAAQRLQTILEENRDRGSRVTVASR